jgi:hypothetical protein
MSNRKKKAADRMPSTAYKYTIYIVSRNRDHHYPVLMANNGKAALNEPSGRAAKLEISAQRFLNATGEGYVTVERITEAAFKAKFPRFAPNKGGKKKAEKVVGTPHKVKVVLPAKPTSFKKGDKVVVNAQVWGQCKAVVLREGSHKDLWRVRITAGPHKGHEGTWHQSDIRKA